MSDALPDPNILMVDMSQPQVVACFGGKAWAFSSGYTQPLEHETKFDRAIVKAMLRSAVETMEEQ